jgi:hypothetical protein
MIQFSKARNLFSVNTLAANYMRLVLPETLPERARLL